MSEAKLNTLETTFMNEFLIDRFTKFTKEFFNNVTIVSPDKENDHIYAEFKFTIASYTHVATYIDENKKKMGIFAIKLRNNRSVNRSRGIQRSFVSRLLDIGNLDAALVAFYAEDDPVWRLSFIKLDYEFVAGRAKKNITPAKRYSYLVGKGEPCHTAVEQLYPIFKDDQYNPTVDKIETAFSLQRVTDKFFKEYKEKYLDVKEYLDRSEDFNEQAKLHHFTSEQFAKKLMGQIAFLYFIQKKGWLGVKAIPSRINKKEYEKAFYKFGKSSREVVNKLFVQTGEDEYSFNLTAFKDFSEDELNVAGECFEPEPWGCGSKSFMRDMFDAFDEKNRNYFNEFLEPLFYDALNKKRGGNQYYSKLNKRIPFLNGGLFQPLDNYDWKRNDFSIPNYVFSNIKTEGREANGILDVFGRYNFTVNESEPFETEVAVDPEMLGKIFENLLDISDRKSKGTFYTPREIVSYMCKESLINYLVNKTGVNYQDIEEFILYGEVLKDYDCSKEGKESDNLQIPKAVFDHLLDIDDALKNVKIADPAVGSGAFPLGMVNEIVRIRTNITYYMARELSQREARLLHIGERHPYWLKRKAIESSIYAVDIDESAVDITKLRLWLSLVVDDEINPSADANSVLETAKRDPHTLPNLDCHVLCGDSLVDEIDRVKLFNESILYGENQTDEWQVPSMLQRQYESLLQQLFDAQDNLYSAESTEVKDDLKAKIKAIIDQLVRINLNPQLGASQTIIEKYEKSLDEESKPYFLWKLEFGKVFKDNGGFDIVIGNPPYIGFHNVPNKDYHNTHYFVASGKYDFYILFIERGLQLLRENGFLSFICPSYFYKRNYGKNTRKLLLSQTEIQFIADFKDYQIFDTALTYTCIFGVQKKKATSDNFRVLGATLYGGDVHYLNQRDLNEPGWNLEKLENNNILNKVLELSTTTLGDITKSISQGIVTGYNDIYLIESKVVESQHLEKEFLKKAFKGKDIKNGELVDSDMYLFYPYYLNGNGKTKCISEDNFIKRSPNLYQYLLQYKQELLKRDYFLKSNKQWFELWNPRSLDHFYERKFVFSEIGMKNDFVLVDECFYTDSACGAALKPDYKKYERYILLYLNSDIITYLYKKISVPKANGYSIYKNAFLNGLPIIMSADIDKELATIENMERQEFEEYLGSVIGIDKEARTIICNDLSSYGITIDQ